MTEQQLGSYNDLSLEILRKSAHSAIASMEKLEYKASDENQAMRESRDRASKMRKNTTLQCMLKIPQ